MNIELWQLFVDTAEAGSFSKVAMAQGVSQPHISRQLSTLEHSCGQRLFERTGRGVTLTEFGRLLTSHAEALQSLLSRASGDVAGKKRGM